MRWEKQQVRRASSPKSFVLYRSSIDTKSKQGGRANDSREERKAAIREMKRTTKCHNCGEVGHWSRECKKEKNQRFSRGNREKTKKKSDQIASFSYCTQSLAFVANSLAEKDCDAWFLDGGASEHMTHHREWFHNLEPVEKGTWFVGVADDTQLPVEGIGDIEITCCANEEVRKAVLRGALYVPQLKKNLFSVGQAADKGFDTVYSKDTCRLVTTRGEVVISGMRHQGLYRLDIKAVSSQANIASSARSHETDLMLWHHRLGHVNLESIRRMKNEKMIDGLPEGLKEPLDDFCEACVLGKQHRLTFSTRAEHKRAEKPGEFFHTDICSMETESIGGSKYFLLFKDDHSGYRFIFCIKRKSNVFQCFKDLQELVKMELNTDFSGIKKIRSDRGGEFLAKKFASHLKAAGIFHEVSAPYSPKQNGRVERDNRTVTECVRSMLATAQLGDEFWAEAAQTEVYILNRTATRTLQGKTPLEAWNAKHAESTTIDYAAEADDVSDANTQAVQDSVSADVSSRLEETTTDEEQILDQGENPPPLDLEVEPTTSRKKGTHDSGSEILTTKRNIRPPERLGEWDYGNKQSRA
ncbi:hypothetical protein R1sor_017515 [Riccia sorocarpa]|uniref:Polyprotein n=1 Tax=Riccia sorocarpa TaxID=122646 RepID=A0ABD3I737_9MARC